MHSRSVVFKSFNVKNQHSREKTYLGFNLKADYVDEMKAKSV